MGLGIFLSFAMVDRFLEHWVTGMGYRFVLCWCAAVVMIGGICGCSKVHPQDNPVSVMVAEGNTEVAEETDLSEEEQTNSESVDGEFQVEQKTEVSEVLPEPEGNVPDLRWMPKSVDLDSIHGMVPEEAERMIVSTFWADSVEDTQEVQELRQKADAGDDSACEQIALIYLRMPATDPRHELGMGYLKKVKNIQSAKALYLRGLAEYNDDSNNVEAAKPYLVSAFEKEYVPAMRYLYDNMIFDMHDEAWKKLSDYYAVHSERAETFLEYFRLQDFEPDEKSLADREAYIEKGISRGFPDAYYARALMLMDTGKWQEGYENLKKSAELGSREGNALLASMYVAAEGASSAEEATENTGIYMTEEQYRSLKNDLISSGNGRGLVEKYSHNAGGNMIACGILLGQAASEEESPVVAQARADVLECVRSYLKENHSRSDCEMVMGLSGYSSDSAEFGTIFSDEERQMIGEEVVGCLNQALRSGDDYTAEGPEELSTALRIAEIYGHDNVYSIARDTGRELQYIMYAAYRGDVEAQSVLSQYYLAGKVLDADMSRACYWSKQALGSTICMEGGREAEYCMDAKVVKEEACK